MKKRISLIILILIILSSSIVIFQYLSLQDNTKLTIKTEEIQNEWHAIDTNMQSLNRLSTVTNEKYSKITSNRTYYENANKLNSEYLITINKNDKYKLYKKNKESIDEVNTYQKNSKDHSNEPLLTSLLTNSNKLIKTIDIQVEDYNKKIKEYKKITNKITLKTQKRNNSNLIQLD